MAGKSPGHHRSERADYVSGKDRRRMLEVSIVDPKVGKSSWIDIINCHHGRGRRCRGGGRGDGAIACGSTTEATNDNCDRADRAKCWFHSHLVVHGEMAHKSAE